MTTKLKTAVVCVGLALSLASGFAQAEEPAAKTGQTERTTTEQSALTEVLKTKIALAKAKVAELQAKVALEIEKAPENAGKALDEADAWLVQAKETAVAEVSTRIDELRSDVRKAKDTIISAPAKARETLDELTDRTERRIENYKQVILDTEEAKLLQRRYAEVEAQAALLKAQLAEKIDASGKSALTYLDKAKAWYADAKANSAKKWHDALAALSERIEGAKQVVKAKREKAAEEIIDLSKRAADLVKGSADEGATKEQKH